MRWVRAIFFVFNYMLLTKLLTAACLKSFSGRFFGDGGNTQFRGNFSADLAFSLEIGSSLSLKF